jgi:hypothetical protein
MCPVLSTYQDVTNSDIETTNSHRPPSISTYTAKLGGVTVTTHNCCQARTWVPGGSISRLILKSFIFKFSTNTINWTIFNGIKQSNIRSPSPIFQPTPSTEQSSGPSSISSSVPSTSKSLGSTKSTSASPEIALASTAFQTN